jgi:tetratricopeptide (TPR) repeat protein
MIVSRCEYIKVLRINLLLIPMENQWKEDFDKFMESLYNGVTLKELMGGYMKSLLAAIPCLGNYFSSALSSYDHAVQMKALYRIFQLSKEYKDEIARMKDETSKMKEFQKIEEIIRILEREGRRFERERLPYQIFHPHQFNEVKTILRYSPEEIGSHIERDVEKVKLEDFIILVGKIGAGKTTTLMKIVERSNPNLIVVIKDNIRAIEAEKLYSVEYLDKCIVIWDDIQYSSDKFLEVLPILRELNNIRFIGSIRSTDYSKLEKDKYFGEMQFKKIDIEELAEKEVEELVELLESEFEKPLGNLKPRFIRKVMEADGTPFYIVSAFRNPDPFTAELIENFPEEVTEIWSRYFMDLNNNEKCVVKTLRMIRENLGVPATEFIRDLYNKAFYGDPNGFFISLESLKNKGWVSTAYFKQEETEIILSRDAQLFCFELDALEKEDFCRCLLNESLKPEKFHSIILLAISYLLLVKDDFEGLIRVSNKAIEINSESALAYFGRGYSYFKLESFDEAIEDFMKAIELNPNDIKFYVSLGNVYSKLGRFDKAIEYLDKVIKLDPEDKAIFKVRGDIYSKFGRFDEAIEDFNKAIELNPRNAVVHNNRGYAYFKLGKFKEALEDYRKAIDLDSNYAVAYSNRGDVYFQMKRVKKALKDYDEAIRLDPTDVHSHVGRGNAYNKLRKYEEAAREYSEALRISIDKGMIEYASEISRCIFYSLKRLDIEFRIKNGIYACAIDYLRNHVDSNLISDVWVHRSSLGESPERIIIYFLGGICGLGEDIFSLKDSVKNEEYLGILSLIIQSLRNNEITHETEVSILGMQENTQAWYLLFLCLKKFLQINQEY